MITATISTYNREKYLPGVLASLARQTLDKSLFEIVLVNNNSPGNTEEIALQFEKDHPELTFRYCVETNQGLSFGRNRGIAEAKGKYITFIDDDAFLADDYLEVIYHYFEQHPDVVALGGKIKLHYEVGRPAWESRFLISLMGYFNKGDQELQFDASDYPRGSNMAFTMQVFEELGDFDVRLGRIGAGMGGSEEKDLFDRIHKHPSYKVMYLPNAIVFHCVPIERTTQEFIEKQAYGTGVGERLRVKLQGGSAGFKRGFQEIIKWMGSIVLFFAYTLKGDYIKGKMIIVFRKGVSKGFFFTKS